MNAPPKPSLLYVINHIDWFWSHRLPLARGAQKAGWDVSVAVPHATQDPNLGKEGFIGLDLPAPDQGFAPVAVLKTIVALRKMIKDQKPDLVHAITLKYAFITGLAALGLKTRLVHTIAGLGYLFSGEGLKPKILRLLVGPFLKLALRRTGTQLIFQNPDDQRIMIERGFADPAQAHLIRGSGVDTDDFAPRPLPEEDQPPLVVMPTRLVHDKGVAVFVEAARQLKQQGVQARFQIAGGVTKNNPLAMTQAEIEAMVADGAAQWLGKVSDMPALLAQARIVAYPSYYREGIPKVLLEAAAMGKAIITTDHPGCREAVDAGENGLLVPVKDAQSLALAIKTLLDDPQLCAAMGEKSRQKALEEFDVRLIVEQTVKLYR